VKKRDNQEKRNLKIEEKGGGKKNEDFKCFMFGFL